PIAPGAELPVDALEDSRVAVQRLHDRQPDGADVPERSLRRGLAAGRGLPEFAHHSFETQRRLAALLVGAAAGPLGPGAGLLGLATVLVGLAAVLTGLLVGAAAVRSHLDAQVPELPQDQPDPWIEVPLALPLVGHDVTLSSAWLLFNVRQGIRDEATAMSLRFA